MYFIFLLFIIIIICTILFLLIKNTDTFVFKNNNIDNDGNMTFNFITDKNNTKTVLLKYFLVDGFNNIKYLLADGFEDNIIRYQNHPYQKKNTKNLYGIPQHQLYGYGTWDNGYGMSTFSDYIYNQYGVRR